MRMLIRQPRPGDTANIRPSEITPESVYLDRRRLLQAALAAGVAGLGGAWSEPARADVAPLEVQAQRRSTALTEAPNSYEDITSYNNFYEFGVDKSAPAANSGRFKPAPWTVTVSGEAEKHRQVRARRRAERPCARGARLSPALRRGVVDGDSVGRRAARRGAEALQADVQGEVRRVQDGACVRQRCPGSATPVLDWPYVEGLRIDEAMHPLAILAVGLYGKTLPNQNGAPLRLVTPWKYGFKGIKSIVEIRFTEREPPTSWNISAPHEYGFYANVNPNVDHPRWSQARERRIGRGLFESRVPTLMFNGYEQEVASLYKGMDLKKILSD